MNDRDICRHYNKNEKYLSSIKYFSLDKYNYIFSFDSDRLLSTIKYNKYIENLIKAITDIYYSYNIPHHYFIWLYDNGFYKHKNSAALSMNKILFSNRVDYFYLEIEVKEKLEDIILKFYHRD